MPPDSTSFNVLRAVLHRDHHDGRIGRLPPQRRDSLETLHSRHHQIDQHQIDRPVRGQTFQALLEIVGLIDLEAFAHPIEQVLQSGAKQWMIVDQENLQALVTHEPGPWPPIEPQESHAPGADGQDSTV
jgi:hypothetical protein